MMIPWRRVEHQHGIRAAGTNGVYALRVVLLLSGSRNRPRPRVGWSHLTGIVTLAEAPNRFEVTSNSKGLIAAVDPTLCALGVLQSGDMRYGMMVGDYTGV